MAGSNPVLHINQCVMNRHVAARHATLAAKGYPRDDGINQYFLRFFSFYSRALYETINEAISIKTPSDRHSREGGNLVKSTSELDSRLRGSDE